MKIKHHGIAIWIVLSLVIASSISTVIPAINHYAERHSKNSILLSTQKKYSKTSILNNNNNSTVNSLAKNLSYVQEYISASVLQKQKILELSIVGSKRDKNDKSDKPYKESEIGFFNRTSLTKKNRYVKQAVATINNSKNSLNEENNVISQIIPILKAHPYTYTYYLSKQRLIIPNIGFFINPFSSLNSNMQTSGISNNVYNINNNNSNLNGVAFNSEEQGLGAQAISSAGSSLSKVWFHQISFKAKIITFDKNTNSYQYAVPTTRNTNNVTYTSSLKSNIIKTDSQSISENNNPSNNSLYLNSNSNLLSQMYSLLSKKSQSFSSINNNNIPSNFNKHDGVYAMATIKYDSITEFKHNQLWYYWAIGIIIGNPAVVITSFSILRKILDRKAVKLDFYNNLADDVNKTMFVNDLHYFMEKVNMMEKAASIDDLQARFYSLKVELQTLNMKFNEKLFYREDTRNQLTPKLEKVRTNINEKHKIVKECIDREIKMCQELHDDLNKLESSLESIDEITNIKELIQVIATKRELIQEILTRCNNAFKFTTSRPEQSLQPRLNTVFNSITRKKEEAKQRIQNKALELNNNHAIANVELEEIEKEYNELDDIKTAKGISNSKDRIIKRIQKLEREYMEAEMVKSQKTDLRERINRLRDFIQTDSTILSRNITAKPMMSRHPSDKSPVPFNSVSYIGDLENSDYMLDDVDGIENGMLPLTTDDDNIVFQNTRSLRKTSHLEESFSTNTSDSEDSSVSTEELISDSIQFYSESNSEKTTSLIDPSSLQMPFLTNILPITSAGSLEQNEQDIITTTHNIQSRIEGLNYESKDDYVTEMLQIKNEIDDLLKYARVRDNFTVKKQDIVYNMVKNLFVHFNNSIESNVQKYGISIRSMRDIVESTESTDYHADFVPSITLIDGMSDSIRISSKSKIKEKVLKLKYLKTECLKLEMKKTFIPSKTNTNNKRQINSIKNEISDLKSELRNFTCRPGNLDNETELIKDALKAIKLC